VRRERALLSDCTFFGGGGIRAEDKRLYLERSHSFLLFFGHYCLSEELFSLIVRKKLMSFGFEILLFLLLFFIIIIIIRVIIIISNNCSKWNRTL